MLVAAIVLPHGDFAVDPKLLPSQSKSRSEAQRIRSASQQATRTIQSLNLTLLVVITPHGMAMDNDVAIYQGLIGSGFSYLGQDDTSESLNKHWTMKMKDVNMESNVANSMKQYLTSPQKNSDEGQEGVFNERRNCVSGLTAFGGYEDFPLRYGEINPLSFFFPNKIMCCQSSGIHQSEVKNDNEEENVLHETDINDTNDDDDDENTLPCVFISLPTRRYTQGASMAPEMLQLGSDLRDFFDNNNHSTSSSSNERVGVLISADLAHTHQSSGPYGYSPTAQPFDDACGKWAANPMSEEDALLQEAAALLDDAKSCGYLGLVCLHGLLTNNNRKNDSSWDANLLAISHPTYYGMMVSTYIRRDSLQ